MASLLCLVSFWAGEWDAVRGEKLDFSGFGESRMTKLDSQLSEDTSRRLALCVVTMSKTYSLTNLNPELKFVCAIKNPVTGEDITSN